MTVKAKRFRIGVEGATTDGREIQREWLEQMAASYNPAVYTALINLEHIKSYLPDSTFNRYGKVTALFAEEITEGPLAGKMALYADVEPTEPLVELVKKGQKLFTSMEVSPKFADTGKAYLVDGTAVKDLLDVVEKALNSESVRPVADRLTVRSAEIIPYRVEATIFLYPGPEAEPVMVAAKASLQRYIASQTRLGRDIRRSAIYAALHVEGVQRVELTSPLEDVVLDKTQAASCTEWSVTNGGTDE